MTRRAASRLVQSLLVLLVMSFAIYGLMGLMPGDVLLSLDAQPIHNVRDLYRVESSLTAGQAVEAVAMRGSPPALARREPARAPPRPSSGAGR